MDLEQLQWNGGGLLPVVIVDDRTNDVLTLAYANREALERTIATRSTHLYSRSRRALWHKGEASGNTQEVVSIAYDCDADALEYRVIPSGPACHTGKTSCFHQELLPRTIPASSTAARPPSHDTESLVNALHHLETVLEERKTADPAASYVARLYAGGVDVIGKKIGEEATEVVIAAKNASREELVWEAADLIFHLLVLLKKAGIGTGEVGEELLRRAK